MTIILEVPNTSILDGEQDSTGVIHYDPVKTPYGTLSSLKAYVEDDELVIDAVPHVILVAKQGKWNVEPVGVEWEATAYGFSMVTFRARNGVAVYKVLDEDVAWSDSPDEVLDCQLGVLQSIVFEGSGEDG